MSASTAADPGSKAAFPVELFPGRVTSKLWLPCQAPGVVGVNRRIGNRLAQCQNTVSG